MTPHSAIPQPTVELDRLAVRIRSAPMLVVTSPMRGPLVLAVVEPFEIGRDPSVLSLPDPQISRRHLQVEAVGRRVVVSDLGSSNGTTVNGRRLSTRHTLAAGEIVRFGECTLTLVGDGPVRSAPSNGDEGRSPAPTLIERVVAAAVAQSTGAMDHDSGVTAVVLSEIWDATKRCAELGDARWHEVLAVHDRIVRRMIMRHGGAELHSSGGRSVTYFPGGRSALRFAVDTLRAFGAHAAANPLEAIRLRAGVHVGDAVSGDGGGSLYGLIATAAGIAAQARGGEVLVSSMVREIGESRGDQSFLASRAIPLAGGQGELIVHLVAR